MPISSMRWEAYPWKNELALQLDRVVLHVAEALDDDFAGEHSPMDMLERALVLAAFSARRMFEKRLVTEKLASKTVKVRSFPSRSEDFRPPFRSNSGGSAYSNYRFDAPEYVEMRIRNLADEIIHSSQLMVIGADDQVDAGVLVASDWNLQQRLLHFTTGEFIAHTRSILDDRVVRAADGWDPETGKVTSSRD